MSAKKNTKKKRVQKAKYAEIHKQESIKPAGYWVDYRSGNGKILASTEVMSRKITAEENILAMMGVFFGDKVMVHDNSTNQKLVFWSNGQKIPTGQPVKKK